MPGTFSWHFINDTYLDVDWKICVNINNKHRTENALVRNDRAFVMDIIEYYSVHLIGGSEFYLQMNSLCNLLHRVYVRTQTRE